MSCKRIERNAFLTKPFKRILTSQNGVLVNHSNAVFYRLVPNPATHHIYQLHKSPLPTCAGTGRLNKVGIEYPSIAGYIIALLCTLSYLISGSNRKKIHRLHFIELQKKQKNIKHYKLQLNSNINSSKNIFACLFSIHNISLSRHEQVYLSGLRFERYFSHHQAYFKQQFTSAL